MKNITQWKNTQFESSTSVTSQVVSFARAYKKAIIDTLGNDFELIFWNRGHFYISAFFRNRETGTLIYISCRDVRSFPDEWYFNILIRSARHHKDYTGGCNNFTPLYKIYEVAMRLTKEVSHVWEIEQL